jgi:hypothetical protein
LVAADAEMLTLRTIAAESTIVVLLNILYLPVELRALTMGWAVTVNTEIAKTSQFFPASI